MNNTPSVLGEPFFVNLSSQVVNPKVVELSDGNILDASSDEARIEASTSDTPARAGA